jgi:hypothetical protein
MNKGGETSVFCCCFVFVASYQEVGRLNVSSTTANNNTTTTTTNNNKTTNINKRHHIRPRHHPPSLFTCRTSFFQSFFLLKRDADAWRLHCWFVTAKADDSRASVSNNKYRQAGVEVFYTPYSVDYSLLESWSGRLKQ